MKPKQQFNIYLEPELISAAKHRAIDEQLSLSALVSKVLTAYLKGTDDEQPFHPRSEAPADDPC